MVQSAKPTLVTLLPTAAALLGLGLLLLSSCGRVDRPIGTLHSASGQQADDAQGGALGSGGEGACESLARCGGDLLAGAEILDGEAARQWVATTPRICAELTPPMATTDACHGLLLNQDGAGDFRPDVVNIPVRSVSLRMSAGEYRANVMQYAPRQVAFSAACLAAQNAPTHCPTFGRLLSMAVASAADIDDLRCTDDTQGGCICDYELLRITRVMGKWEVKDGSITFYDGTLAPRAPITASYCRGDATLELSEETGSGLFNVPGLRTLTLQPPTCTDGVLDAGEMGVDCGGECGVCSTCDDGLQNGDELGVDCGGSCFNDFCACFNGSQDPWEEGVDCGGPCALLCSCNNAVRDANEEGVDCGGDCHLRYSDPVPLACTP